MYSQRFFFFFFSYSGDYTQAYSHVQRNNRRQKFTTNTIQVNQRNIPYKSKSSMKRKELV